MAMITLNILHLSHRKDRFALFMDELRIQQIPFRRIWEGIADPECPARGILKAHQQIVRFASQEGLKQITIAEDDLKFTAKGAWRYYLQKMPDDFDLYLGGIIWGNIMPDQTVHDFSGTTLYTISEKFYNAFLDLVPGTDFDRQLAGKGRFVVCDPMTAVQHAGFSDNSKRVIDFSKYTDRYQLYNG